MIFDLFYRILPKNLNTEPLYVNNFLPIFTLSGYRSRGFYENATVQHYVQIQNALRDYAKLHRNFILKGNRYHL